MAKYRCENGHIVEEKDMVLEIDFEYDQACCPVCNDVMFDYIHHKQYCDKVED